MNLNSVLAKLYEEVFRKEIYHLSDAVRSDDFNVADQTVDEAYEFFTLSACDGLDVGKRNLDEVRQKSVDVFARNDAAYDFKESRYGADEIADNSLNAVVCKEERCAAEYFKDCGDRSCLDVVNKSEDSVNDFVKHCVGVSEVVTVGCCELDAESLCKRDNRVLVTPVALKSKVIVAENREFLTSEEEVKKRSKDTGQFIEDCKEGILIVYTPCVVKDNRSLLNVSRYGVAVFVSSCLVNRSQFNGLAVDFCGGKILRTVIGFGDVLTFSILTGYIGVSIFGARLRNVSPGQTLFGVGSGERVQICLDLGGLCDNTSRSQVDAGDFLNKILNEVNGGFVETAEAAYDETEKLVNHIIVECHCLKQVIYDCLDGCCFSSCAETVIQILDECDRLVTGCKELENARNCVVDNLVKLADGFCCR